MSKGNNKLSKELKDEWARVTTGPIGQPTRINIKEEIQIEIQLAILGALEELIDQGRAATTIEISKPPDEEKEPEPLPKRCCGNCPFFSANGPWGAYMCEHPDGGKIHPKSSEDLPVGCPLKEGPPVVISLGEK